MNEAELIQALNEKISTLESDRDYWKAEAIKATAELGEIKIAEVQELSIKIPCNIGDTVYWISHFKKGINSGTVHSIRFSKFGFDIEVNNGYTLFWRENEKTFLTWEAAEAALKGSVSE